MVTTGLSTITLVDIPVAVVNSFTRKRLVLVWTSKKRAHVAVVVVKTVLGITSTIVETLVETLVVNSVVVVGIVRISVKVSEKNSVDVSVPVV